MVDALDLSMCLCNHFNSAGVTTLRRSAAAYERELFGHGVPLPERCPQHLISRSL
jgi:hypothetical protein